MEKWWFACIAAVFISSPTVGSTQTAIAGNIQRVIDGDTVVVQTEGGDYLTVRLAGIDAPEMKMPSGAASRNALQGLLEDQSVLLQLQKKDKYGRWVGVLLVDGADINLKMVSLGWAWHYTQYAREQGPWLARLYAQTQQDARQSHSGLWHDEMPTPPWSWRHECRKKHATNPICSRQP